MRENDTTRLPALFPARDILVALGLLSRLPLRLPDAAYARGAAAAWAYPLAGAVLGALAALIGALLLALGLAPAAVALLLLAAQVMLTGAMHEDGLADCADGFWGGWDRQRRLEIMKDSQIGSYGVIALVLALLARWWGLSLLITQDGGLLALIGLAALSRAGMPALMAILPPARAHGLSHAQGRPGRVVVLAALGLALLCALLSIGWATLGLLLLGLGLLLGLTLLARAKIGGQTGDVLGASQQLLEVAFLLVLAG